MILTDTPINPGVFNGCWVRNVMINLPHGTAAGFLQATLLPYNGQHVLVTGEKHVRLPDLTAALQTDAQLTSILNTAAVTVRRLASKADSVEIKNINVSAPSPTRPVSIFVSFHDGSYHVVRDAYALAAADADFAQTFGATMIEIARQAGLTVA